MDRFQKIAYRPHWNYWNGRKNLQLIVEDTDPVILMQYWDWER
jgi:hypothetical protein